MTDIAVLVDARPLGLLQAGGAAEDLAPFGFRANHASCPPERPHATTDRAGDAVMCHKEIAEAQDLALTLNTPDATQVTPGTQIQVGAKKGNAQTLRDYWSHGEGAAKIAWGTPGDFDRCVREVGKYMANPKGYCNLRHHEALGIWPAQHAELERGRKAAAWDEAAHLRVPAGQGGGGQFAPATGGTGTAKQPTPTNQDPVGEGETGQRVTDLQERLNQLGAHLKVDGMFGPATRAAVEAYQKAHGLKVDGLVGPKTTAALRLKTQVPAKGKGQGKAHAAGEPVTVPALVTIPGVELAAAGSWNLSTGRATFTREDLAAVVDAARCPAVGNPVIKIGHLDQRFTPGETGDGEPAIGQVTNIRLDESGHKIIGDLAGMPGWLGAIAASAFPRRSIEGKYGFRCQIGHDHPFALTAHALLGVTPPGVGVLGSLPDIARLYGATTAAAGDWRTEPTDQKGDVAMAVTEEDVRRAYYAAAGVPPTWWITELQMAPTQLVVADQADGKVYRVPFRIDGSAVAFDQPQEVASYADVAAARGNGPVVAYASAEVSRSVVEAAWDAQAQISALGDKPSPSLIKAMFAVPGDTVTDSKLPHHHAADGKVGAADVQGCQAAIGALNGAHGGVSGLSADQKRVAYNHLAAHLRDAGQTPPDFKASAEDPAAAAGPGHGPYSGQHSHPHPAMGTQGGDQTHSHEHSHDNNADHGHDHGPAASSHDERSSDVEFNDEQLAAIRAKLGKKDGEEVTAADIAAAFSAPKAPDVSAAAGDGNGGGDSTELPPIHDGTYLVDAEILRGYQARAAAGDNAARQLRVNERDQFLAAAAGQGKFPQARLDHYKQLWDKDPEGTRKHVEALASGLIPVGTGPAGTNGGFDPELGGDFEGQQAYTTLYPEDVQGGVSAAAGIHGTPGGRRG